MPTVPIYETAKIKIIPIDQVRFSAGALGADLDITFRNVGEDSGITHCEAIYRNRDVPGATLVGFKLTGTIVVLMNNYEDLAEALNDLLTVQPDGITISLISIDGQGGGGEMYVSWIPAAITGLVGVGLSGFKIEQAAEFPRLSIDFTGYALRTGMDPSVSGMFFQATAW